MCMKRIPSGYASFRGFEAVIVIRSAPQSEGDTQEQARDEVELFAGCRLMVAGGRGMIHGLHEIHIKICPIWEVMYSQRHVC